MTRHIQYSVVVPVYNEELVIHETYQRLKEVMDQTKENYELLFVNDGSKDHSIEILREHSLLDPRVKIIDFSRNFGTRSPLQRVWIMHREMQSSSLTPICRTS